MSKGSGGGGYGSKPHVENKNYHLGMGARVIVGVRAATCFGEVPTLHLTDLRDPGHGRREGRRTIPDELGRR
jgi:hypothetical protein